MCSRSRSAVHSRGATRAARATASRSRASSGSAATHRSSSCGFSTTIAASSEVTRFAPSVTAPSAAEATCSGSGSSAGCSAVWISSSFSRFTAAGASVSSRIFTSSRPVRSDDTVASASAADRVACEHLGVRVEAESQPRLEPHTAQEPGRVVAEALVVKHAQQTGVEVGEPTVRIVEVAQIVALEADRHGVDREVATGEVLAKRGRLHPRQGARLVVGLLARGDQVDLHVADPDDRRAEALVLAHLAAEPVGERTRHQRGVALHDEIRPAVGQLAAQQVPHPASDEVGRGQPDQRRQQALHAGQAADSLSQVRRAHSRTGIPAARIRSFASRTV